MHLWFLDLDFPSLKYFVTCVLLLSKSLFFPSTVENSEQPLTFQGENTFYPVTQYYEPVSIVQALT